MGFEIQLHICTISQLLTKGVTPTLTSRYSRECEKMKKENVKDGAQNSHASRISTQLQRQARHTNSWKRHQRTHSAPPPLPSSWHPRGPCRGAHQSNPLVTSKTRPRPIQVKFTDSDRPPFGTQRDDERLSLPRPPFPHTVPPMRRRLRACGTRTERHSPHCMHKAYATDPSSRPASTCMSPSRRNFELSLPQQSSTARVRGPSEPDCAVQTSAFSGL